MAQVRTLQSVAHAAARSFAASCGYSDSDHAFQRLLQHVAQGEAEFEVDLLAAGAVRPASAPPSFREASSRFAKTFPYLVESNNSAMNLVASARLTNQVAIVPDAAVLRGHVTITATIVDVQGRSYTDTFVAPVMRIPSDLGAA